MHTAAAPSLLRIGIPHVKIQPMFSNSRKMIHIIRTSFGDSDLIYRGEGEGGVNILETGKWTSNLDNFKLIYL